MNISRRKILSAGAGLGLFYVASRFGSAVLKKKHEPLELISAFKDTAHSSRHLVSAYRWNSSGSLTVVSSPFIDWSPHSFTDCARFLISTVKNGRVGAVFHRESLKSASSLLAPDGFKYYGHGFKVQREASERFVVSAFRPPPNGQESYAQSGYLLEYELNSDGGTRLVQTHETDGFIPHDFAFSSDGSNMAYTTKFTANGRSQIVICDAVEFRVIRKIEIGLNQNGLVRRLMHLNSADNQLYYSFAEWDGSTPVGGGIGMVDWNGGTKPLWEACYTEQMRDRIATASADTLDLILFQGAPVVVMNGVGSLLSLDVKSQTFSAINIAGSSGATPSRDGQTLVTSSNSGYQSLSKEHRFSTLAENSAANLVPSSHLFHGSTA